MSAKVVKMVPETFFLAFPPPPMVIVLHPTSQYRPEVLPPQPKIESAATALRKFLATCLPYVKIEKYVKHSCTILNQRRVKECDMEG